MLDSVHVTPDPCVVENCTWSKLTACDGEAEEIAVGEAELVLTLCDLWRMLLLVRRCACNRLGEYQDLI